MIKILRFILLSVLFFSFQDLKSQGITTDTILANTYHEVALELADSSNYDSALVYLDKAIPIYQKYSLWRQYITSIKDKGYCHSELWESDLAVNLFRQAVEKTVLLSDSNDMLIERVYHLLGIEYFYMSRYDSTIFCWKKSLEIRQNNFEQNDTRIADQLNNIGAAYYYKSDYNSAIAYYKKALKIRHEVYGENHYDVALSYNNIGLLYSDKSDYNKALEYLFKSKQIMEKINQTDHPLYAGLYMNIGIAYRNKGEFEKALEYT